MSLSSVIACPSCGMSVVSEEISKRKCQRTKLDANAQLAGEASETKMKSIPLMHSSERRKSLSTGGL